MSLLLQNVVQVDHVAVVRFDDVAKDVLVRVLANAGEQDLTAHVNFSAVEKAGFRAGLRTEIFQNQSRFLTGILSRMRGHERGIAQWNAKLTSQFQTLTNPEHLGQSFRVLVQRRAEFPTQV